jgi:subtilisin family serine protease
VKRWIATVVLAVLVVPSGAAAQTPAEDSWIVMYERAAVDSVDRETDARERRRGFRSRARFKRAIEGFSARLTDAQVRALRADPDVAAVVRDRPVRASGAQPIEPGDLAPTGVRRLGLAAQPSASPRWVRDASDVGVAVLDTGIDVGHPDLNAVSGRNCVGAGAPTDVDGHGTHVAGTIGARDNGTGVTGAAPGSVVHAVKVLDDDGSGSTGSLICGLDWVLANASARNIRVINMSLGGTDPEPDDCAQDSTDPLHLAICRTTSAGILSVVAAGNESSDIRSAPIDPDDPDSELAPATPAIYPEVLTVSAINDHDGLPGRQGTSTTCGVDDRRAPYSNWATLEADRAHMIAAPGTCILSTWPGGDYATISGTSMATPHVAGAAALCFGEAGEAGPCAGMSPAQIITRLRDEARAHRLADPASGFQGDPEEEFPTGSGRYYGHLLRPLLAGPGTSIGAAPPANTDDSTPAYAFASATQAATFECSVDGGAFAACSSPFETGPLADGSHSFAVRAVDVLGTRDGTPATHSFTVDTTPDPPVTTNTTPPPSSEAADRTPPALTIGAASRRRLTTALRRGIRVNVLCNEACRAESRLELSGSTAGRKGLTLGSGKRTVTIKLTSATRRRLARVRSVLLRLRVTVTDAAGNTRSTKKNLRLTR